MNIELYIKPNETTIYQKVNLVDTNITIEADNRSYFNYNTTYKSISYSFKIYTKYNDILIPFTVLNLKNELSYKLDSYITLNQKEILYGKLIITSATRDYLVVNFQQDYFDSDNIDFQDINNLYSEKEYILNNGSGGNVNCSLAAINSSKQNMFQHVNQGSSIDNIDTFTDYYIYNNLPYQPQVLKYKMNSGLTIPAIPLRDVMQRICNSLKINLNDTFWNCKEFDDYFMLINRKLFKIEATTMGTNQYHTFDSGLDYIGKQVATTNMESRYFSPKSTLNSMEYNPFTTNNIPFYIDMPIDFQHSAFTKSEFINNNYLWRCEFDGNIKFGMESNFQITTNPTQVMNDVYVYSVGFSVYKIDNEGFAFDIMNSGRNGNALIPINEVWQVYNNGNDGNPHIYKSDISFDCEAGCTYMVIPRYNITVKNGRIFYPKQLDFKFYIHSVIPKTLAESSNYALAYKQPIRIKGNLPKQTYLDCFNSILNIIGLKYKILNNEISFDIISYGNGLKNYDLSDKVNTLNYEIRFDKQKDYSYFSRYKIKLTDNDEYGLVPLSIRKSLFEQGVPLYYLSENQLVSGSSIQSYKWYRDIKNLTMLNSQRDVYYNKYTNKNAYMNIIESISINGDYSKVTTKNVYEMNTNIYMPDRINVGLNIVNNQFIPAPYLPINVVETENKSIIDSSGNSANIAAFFRKVDVSNVDTNTFFYCPKGVKKQFQLTFDWYSENVNCLFYGDQQVAINNFNAAKTIENSYEISKITLDYRDIDFDKLYNYDIIMNTLGIYMVLEKVRFNNNIAELWLYKINY